jgi:hypothetical protein
MSGSGAAAAPDDVRLLQQRVSAAATSWTQLAVKAAGAIVGQ